MTDLVDLIAKRVNPPEKDAWVAVGYYPSERQQLFHRLSRERPEALLYGGSRGGGKTAALLMECFWYAVNVDKITILCARRSYPELEESFIRELAKRDFGKPLGARWNQTSFRLRFPNGSSINFTYAATEQDMSKLRGGEYQLICVDEASLMPQVVLEQFEEQLRSGTRGVPVVGLRLASNPGGSGHTYLKNRFIKPTEYGQQEYFDELGRRNLYVPAKATDNPHIDSGYLRILDSIPDPIRRAAMRDGDWDVTESSFFPQWRADKHVVQSFPVPPDWQRYAGVDYGFAAPWATIWGAVDNDGRMWIYRERYATQVNAEQQALQILETELAVGETAVVRVGDPSMWGQRGTPLTIADIYGQQGVGLLPANNDRATGWARFHWYLNEGITACEYHREMGWTICPMLHVFGDQCPMFIEEVTNLPRDPNNPDDAATRNVQDHAMDATRYLLMFAGNYGRPVFHDDNQSPPARPQKPAQEEQEVLPPSYPEREMLVAGRFAGDLSLSSYL